MGVQYTPRGQRKRRRTLAAEERAWAARNRTDLQVTYTCICDRNPATCRAALHTTTP